MAAYGRRVVYFSTILFVLFYAQTNVQGLPPFPKGDTVNNFHGLKNGNPDDVSELHKFPQKSKDHFAGKNNFHPNNKIPRFYAPPGENKLGINNKPVDHLGQQPQFRSPKPIKIADSPECAEDVQRFCSRGIRGNNFAILNCLQSDLKTDEELNVQCHHFLWSYKMNLTKDIRFESASREVCKQDLIQISECTNLEKGQVIPCLIENFENVTNKNCQQFLHKMAPIVFSDYRLVYNFLTNCHTDIGRTQCGRLDSDMEAAHSQGSTLQCLADKMRSLSNQCKLQVLRVYELQSDDYHMDRPLYYACRDDRERLCQATTSGNGKIFECLFKHIADKLMSSQCREKLELRQRLIAEDVKVDKSFFMTCREDIMKYHCLEGADHHEDTRRATVLLCLEDKVKNDQPVDGECLGEMRELRRTIMEDYNVSPDIVAKCGHDIESYCAKVNPGDSTLHCLMSHARSGELSSECRAQLEALLKEADVDQDFTIDRTLQKACQDVVGSLCGHIHPGDSRIINCLMENLDNDDMTDRCEKHLLNIQFFFMRDFKLDHHLYKSCRKDARKLCSAGENWHQLNDHTPEQGPLVFACLHHHIKRTGGNKQNSVSRACKQEVRRVMKARAKDVKLNFEIQELCHSDLAVHCSDDKSDFEKGGELECLQTVYDELQPACKKLIANITEEEDEDLELDNILMKACTPMIKKFCNDLLDQDADPPEVLDCLIEHKLNHDMNPKCAAGVEHHQLISLKEFRFNHKFKQACQKSVMRFCKDKNTKYEVVTCLSSHVRNDTLLDKDHRIEKACRRQLRVEVLRRGESINLDPELKGKCSEDIQKYCGHVTPGNAAVLECLKSHQRNLNNVCHKLLFKREKDEFAIGDYGLLSACKRMIEEHCDQTQDEPEILECLKKHKNDHLFDSKCRQVILRRQVLQSHDYRLNPSLKKACEMDIGKFCAVVVDNNKNDIELEGKVISCLKKQFAVRRLTLECTAEISQAVEAGAEDIRMAPVLQAVCKWEIKKLCSDEMYEGRDNELEMKDAHVGGVAECLKTMFYSKKLTNKKCISEVAALIQEEEIDINVDPILKHSCMKDIYKLCKEINPGEGRHMSCLLSVLEQDPSQLTKDCRKKLSLRREMWEYAAQVAPLENFSELYTQISQSPAKMYLLSIISVVICIIFIVGLGCGRVTKRVRKELKNK
ncbi:Golgi apparatus protein 1-like [Gigantopelta aegis]|uniref:Golgi apparatus protein 1-like n=1 Tax=Gigantopelta aegis TaxID=1735272 RepID=UPI001B88A832|nr:Golgi apparatus protein 1-like [Gigantopelta aegis]